MAKCSMMGWGDSEAGSSFDGDSDNDWSFDGDSDNDRRADMIAEITEPEHVESSPEWVEDFELDLKANVTCQWKLAAAGELLRSEQPRDEFDVCPRSGLVFVAQSNHIYAFSIQKYCPAREVSDMIVNDAVSHVACGGVYNERPVGAAVDVSGAIVIFHSSASWKGDRIIQELHFQLGVALSSNIKVRGAQFVDDDELVVLYGPDFHDSFFHGCKNSLVGFPLKPDESPRTISSSFPQQKLQIRFCSLSSCRVWGKVINHASEVLLHEILARHMLKWFDMRTLMGTIVRLGSHWRVAVEQILCSPVPKIEMQVDCGFKDGHQCNYLTFHTPAQGEVCEPVVWGSSFVKLAPTLHGVVVFCDSGADDLYDAFLADNPAPSSLRDAVLADSSAPRSTHSSAVLRVCVAIRCVCTAQVGLKILSKRLEDVTASDGLPGDHYGMAIVGRNVLLLNSCGLLRSLSLHIAGFPDHCSSDDDGQEEYMLEPEEGGHVIHEVLHDEAPATMSSVKAAEIEEQLWAGRIQGLPAGSEDSSDLDEDLVLLTCNRRPECMVVELNESKSLRACRRELEAAGYSWKLPSGALIFVHPRQYCKLISTVATSDLKAFNIIIARDLEYLLEEALANAGQGAWMKDRQHINILGESASSASQSGVPASDRGELGQFQDSEVQFEFDRTFLCIAPQRRDPKSVTQSTTEARSHAGLNPRRICSTMHDL